MQLNEDETEIIFSFARSKLTGSQLSWAAIEKRRLSLYGLSRNSVLVGLVCR